MKKNIEANELYKTETNLDYEEYKKYNKALFKTFSKRKLLLLLLLFAVIYSVVVFQNRTLTAGLIFSIILGIIIGIFLGMLLIKLLRSITIKTTYKTLEKHSKENLNTKIYFYKDYLIQESSISTYKLEYSKIYKIIETEENFYIMINERQGIAIIKKNCTEELISFLRKTNNK